MHLDASSKNEYLLALEELDRHPVVGTYSIGDLTITCSHASFEVVDLHGNRYAGRASTPRLLREGVGRGVRKWLRDNNVR